MTNRPHLLATPWFRGLTVLLLAAGLGGCAVVTVAGAAAGAAISVTGAVVARTGAVTGKVVGKAIEVVVP